MVVADSLIAELEQTILRKRYLSEHIRSQDLSDLLLALRTIGERIPPGPAYSRRLTRDLTDDCLLAAALLADVDVHVSGDAGLLSLREHLDRPRIVTARALVDELGAG